MFCYMIIKWLPVQAVSQPCTLCSGLQCPSYPDQEKVDGRWMGILDPILLEGYNSMFHKSLLNEKT